MKLPRHCSVLFAVVIKFVVAEPFFGLKIQGGFKTETDISSAAQAVLAPFAQLKTSLVNFNKSYPFSTVVLSDAADGVNFLYNGVVNEMAIFTNSLSDSVLNSQSNSTLLFISIKTALQNAQIYVKNTVPETNKISGFSSKIGGTLIETYNNIGSILNDLSEDVNTFEEAIAEIDVSVVITSSSIYKIINKFQLAHLIGALEVLQVQMDVVRAKIVESVSGILSSESLMSSFTSKLTDSFAALDSSLSQAYNAIMKSSDSFQQQLSNSLNQLNSATNQFNDKIRSYTDDIIGANSSIIVNTTREFTDFYVSFLHTLIPNSEEKFNSVAYMVTDSVQTAASDIMFNSYQMMNNAIQNLPSVITCATKFLTPLEKTLSVSVPTFGPCLNLLNSQTITNDVVAVLNTLLADRMFYVNLWTSTISGITVKSDSSVRKATVMKLLSKTPSSNIDVHQPALVDTFSIFAQIVSNFNALQNRVIMCLTLKSVDISAMVIAASNGYFNCINTM
ncbi:uncharacterized protein LOC129726742 [Wyeomyia smithii]|uniref:uncharacterized protein LOC129726742 n=1 Tax=Wyeomyia smithii TaxID=174621 RepID=UPI002467EF24|nr:uncharacterized protein LOC129726742 [Wyeomyia smithii]